VAETKPVAGKIGLTRGKAVLIGALAIALVAVVYIQYGGSSGHEPLTMSENPPRPPLPRSAAQATEKQSVDGPAPDEMDAAVLAFDQQRWKSPELTTVIAYDPFALPTAFPQPAVIDPRLAGTETDELTTAENAKQLAEAVERLHTQLEELKERGVHVILNQGDQYVAMIGERMIHVGDEINGFTVMEIDPTGVRVERKDPE
jgi:hypothetical protein